MTLILETERLTIRQAIPADAPFILELLTSEKWLKYIGDRGVRSLHSAQMYIHETLVGSYEKNGFGLYILERNDVRKPVGLAGFVKRDYLDNPDLGFAMLETYEGLGFAYEATNNLLKYGKNVLHFEVIHAITAVNNEASQSLLKKLGMKSEGTITPPGGKEAICLFSFELTS